MADLQTTYMGLNIKNPLIVASSGLTRTLGKLEACQEAGAGAVVLKSLFEESLAREDRWLKEAASVHTEAYDYLRAEISLQYGPEEYCDLISQARKKLEIPVIASINCITDKWWPKFARKIEEAGAHALELNIYPMVNDTMVDSAAVDQHYLRVLEEVKNVVNIPVAMKISMYISALPYLSKRLSDKGLNGLVMFNRFVEPDIDIETLKLKTTFPFSDRDDMFYVLRWTALLADKIDADISATTGIHSSEAIIKLLLAGARTVQLASVLYKHGFKRIGELLGDIDYWMDDHGFDSIDDFCGRLSFEKAFTPDLYLRSQFMERIREVE